MHRRSVITGLSATAALPLLAAPALGAAKASRSFRIIRDGDDIGSHDLDAVLGPNGFELVITARIAVKFLGVTAYRYELDNREVWKDGQIVSVRSRVNDDGTAERADVRAAADGLVIDGSRFSGTAPTASVTTSYYAPQFLRRTPWISTQSGAPLSPIINAEGRAGWWKITGELETVLGYTGGEWTGCEFDAGGELAQYNVTKQTGGIGALWAEA